MSKREKQAKQKMKKSLKKMVEAAREIVAAENDYKRKPKKQLAAPNIRVEHRLAVEPISGAFEYEHICS